MAPSINQVLAQMQRWTAARTADLSDAVLLERYIHERDQAAFAALVARYGGLVLRVCRRILGANPEVEDAFQASFVVLARKAPSLRQAGALAGWLHTVAHRIALKARAQAKGRHSFPSLPLRAGTSLDETLPDPQPDPLTQLTARELLDIVEEEVRHLPIAQRSVVLLCCLEGHSREEAARRLGWTPGAVKNHLQRGRRRLQDRLRRRGIALSSALAVVAVSRGEAASTILLRKTVQAAFSGGMSVPAASLAHPVIRGMLWSKVVGVTALLLSVALAASATVALVYRGPEAETPQDETPPVTPSRKADTDKPPARTDAFGDPLPDGVLRRLGTLRFRHGGGNICNLLLTKDGKTLVSNTYYGSRTVCVWDMATGKLRWQFPGTFEHKNIAVSADGKLVAIGQKEAIVLWDLTSGKEVRRLPQPDASGFAFSPDGKTLAAAGYDPDIQLWNLADGKQSGKIPWKRGSSSVVQLAYTADGKILIAAQHFDSKIALFDVATGKQRELDAKTGDIFSFAVSADGSILTSGSRQGVVSLWDVKKGNLLRRWRLPNGKECIAVAFSPDGKTLAEIEHDPHRAEAFLALWDVNTGKELSRFKGDFAFWNLVFAPDGKTLIAGWDSAIRLWDVATAKEVGPAASSPPLAFALTLSPDGRMLAYREQSIRLWDMVRSREIGSLPRSVEDGLSLAFSPDGKTLATGTIYNTISLWDLNSRKRIRTLKGDAKNEGLNFGHFAALAFAPDGKTFASAGGDGAVRLWETDSGKEIRRLSMLDNAEKFGTCEAVAFSPDGKTLAASGRGRSDSSKVRLWDVATGQPLTHRNVFLNDPADKGPPDLQFNHGKIIEPKIVFAPDGRMLAMNRWQKTVPVWEAATGRQRLLLQGHGDSTVCVAFAPDSRTLASASWDNTIRLWDLDTGRELRKLTGHRGKANSLAFSADGNVLISAGDDSTVLFWDVAGVTHRKHPHVAPLAKEEWQSLWEDLARDDAAKAYAAMVRMAADSPTTVAALKERLHPIRPADPERLARLLKDLDSDDFSVRETASRELEKLGDVAGPAVRQGISRPGLSLELRRRLEAIAATLEALAGERLRQVRAVELLELAGTKEAREVLEKLAAGAGGARLTEETKAALKRLASGAASARR